MRKSLRIAKRWCGENGFSVKSIKSDLVLFSRRTSGSDKVGKTIDLKNQVKCLGVILHYKSNWNWGLSSKDILLMFEAVIRSIVCHRCTV